MDFLVSGRGRWKTGLYKRNDFFKVYGKNMTGLFQLQAIAS